MKGLEIKTGCVLDLDKDNGELVIVSETPRKVKLCSFVAAVNDDPEASFMVLFERVENGDFDSVPNMYDIDHLNNVYVQYGYDDDTYFDNINLSDARDTVIHIASDSIPMIDKGDIVDLNPKWNIKLLCLKEISMAFFVQMCKTKQIDLDDVKLSDRQKLIETGYFATPTSGTFTLEREGTCFHLR